MFLPWTQDRTKGSTTRRYQDHRYQRDEKPTTKKEVRAFLGMSDYYRIFVSGYAEKSTLLAELLEKGVSDIVSWSDREEKSF